MTSVETLLKMFSWSQTQSVIALKQATTIELGKQGPYTPNVQDPHVATAVYFHALDVLEFGRVHGIIPFPTWEGLQYRCAINRNWQTTGRKKHASLHPTFIETNSPILLRVDGTPVLQRGTVT
jgi:hypothetical protein